MFKISLNRLYELAEEAEKNNTESAWYGSVYDTEKFHCVKLKVEDAIITWDVMDDDNGHIGYECLEISIRRDYWYNTWEKFECCQPNEPDGDTNDIAEDFAYFLAEEMVSNPSKAMRKTAYKVARLLLDETVEIND